MLELSLHAEWPYRTRRIIYRRLTLLTLIFFIGIEIIPILSTIHAQNTENIYETLDYEWSWLWDPESPTLEDWQIIMRPQAATLTPWGDILVADTGNSRLIRFTSSGELIEIIGRGGAGPGEYSQPNTICFIPNSTDFFVSDQGNMRVSRLRMDKEETSFLDSFLAPQLRGVPPMTIAVTDSSTYWYNSIMSGFRISQIDDNGIVQCIFGDFFKTSRPEQNEMIYNGGLLFITNDLEISFIGKYKPIFERWSIDGHLLYSNVFPFPEVKEAEEREKKIPAGRFHLYTAYAVYVDEIDSFFIRIAPSIIYEVSPESFNIKRRYYIHDVGASDGPFVVEIIQEEIRFVIIDSHGGVKIASPVDIK